MRGGRLRGTRRGRRETLTASEDMTVAFNALSSFQQVTQQADAKANMLLAVHVGLIAVVATQVGQAAHTAMALPVEVLFWMVGAAYLVTFVVSGYLLLQVIRPRSPLSDEANRFSLSRPSGHGTSPAASEHPPGVVAAEAWEVAHAVAGVASVKNRYVARALAWEAAMVVAGAGWLAIISLIG